MDERFVGGTRWTARRGKSGLVEHRLEGRLAELHRAGLIRPPERPLDVEAFLSGDRPRDPAGRALESILEDRAEGW